MVALTISFVAPSATHGKTMKKAKSSGADPKSKITITYPEKDVTASGGFIDLEYKANDAEVSACRVKVTTETDGYSGPVSPKSVRLFLFKGKNTIKLTGYKDGVLVPGATAEIVATCNRGCIADGYPLGGPIHPIDHVAVENQEQKPPKPSDAGGTAPRNISIRVPSEAAATIEPTIVVQEKSAIKSVYVDVYNGSQRIDAKNALKLEYIDGIAILPVKLKLASGANRISVFDIEHLGDAAYSAVATVNCAADKCKGETGGAAMTKNIKILAPTEGNVKKAKLDFYVSIAKGSKTKKLVSVVFKDGESAVVSEPFEVPKSDNNDVEINHSVQITKGESTVSFMDPEHVGEAAFVDKVKINCDDKCAGADSADSKAEFSVD